MRWIYSELAQLSCGWWCVVMRRWGKAKTGWVRIAVLGHLRSGDDVVVCLSKQRKSKGWMGETIIRISTTTTAATATTTTTMSLARKVVSISSCFDAISYAHVLRSFSFHWVSCDSNHVMFMQIILASLIGRRSNHNNGLCGTKMFDIFLSDHRIIL